jgi:hypothetical protein
MIKTMCKAFSCIIDKNKKIYWRLNLDSHDAIIKEYNLDEKKDSVQFVRVEVAPKNGSYLKPDKWVFKIDEESTPDWFSPAHKEACMTAFRVYKKQLYKILVKKEIVHPFNDIKFKGKITLEHKLLLKEWDSVWNSVEDSVKDSVRDSVGDSVWDSVGDSVWDSVGDSVRGSVWDSVWNSVWGYIGSFFRLKREQWKHTEKIQCKGDYPFQSIVDLWMMGLVPSFDGTTWWLHAGRKAKIVYSITKEELQKIKEDD